MLAITPDPASTQADQASNHIRREILSCRLAPGTKIRINEVAARLDVSVGAVREALSRLAAEGLTVPQAQRGYSVAAVSADELRDLTETRITIEKLCLQEALAHGGLEWENALIAAAQRLRQLHERDPEDFLSISDQWTVAHACFHEAIVAGARSKWLLRVRHILYAQGERYRHLSVPMRNQERDVHAEHDAMLEAAINRDTNRLCSLMDAHLWQTTDTLLQSPILLG
jgi:DNA-binding GntR family transcriptional regulator